MIAGDAEMMYPIGKEVSDSNAPSRPLPLKTEPAVAPPPPPKKTADTDTVAAMEQLAKEWGAMNQDHDGTPAEPVFESFSAPPLPEASVAQPLPTASSSSSVSSGPTMDQLAKEWGAMNQDHDTVPTVPTPTKENKVSTKRQEPPAAETHVPPPIKVPSATTMDDLAKAWGAMNQDHGTTSSAASSPVVPASRPSPQEEPIAEAPPQVPAPPIATSTTMDDLAREWGAMNQDHDSMASTVAFTPPRTSFRIMPQPQESITESVQPPASSATMEDLAREWGAMNQDHSTDTQAAFTPPSESPVSPPQETIAPASSTTTTAMDDLAREWGAMNKDHDTMTTPSAVPPPEPTFESSTPPPATSATTGGLAREWGATKNYHDSPTGPASSAPQTPQEQRTNVQNVDYSAGASKEDSAAQSGQSGDSQNTSPMDKLQQLAREWAAMNRDDSA